MWQGSGGEKRKKKKKNGHTFHFQRGEQLINHGRGGEPEGGVMTEYSSCSSFASCVNHQEKEAADWTPRQ